MKRALLSTMALFAALMVGPGMAMAHKNTSASHHSKQKHHAGPKHHGARARVRVERFGSTSPQPSTQQASSDNAGTVKSFMGNTLIITVNGSDVSGTVTPSTKLECESAAGVVTAKMSKDGNGQSGDGGHGTQPGDDNGQAQDQNDANDQAEDQNDVNDQNDANDQNDGQNAKANCTPADLTNGAVVREAVLRVSSAGQTWEKVELVK